MDGFLNNLPDLGLSQRKKKKRPKVRKAKIQEDQVKAVIWHAVRCPRCDSDKTVVHTTRKPIRYHKCLNCGYLFKSVEQKQQKSS